MRTAISVTHFREIWNSLACHHDLTGPTLSGSLGVISVLVVNGGNEVKEEKKNMS